MLRVNDIDQDFFLFLPKSTRAAILDAEDIAGTLDKLGYNVPHLISVFEVLGKKWRMRVGPGIVKYGGKQGQ
ncbi:MAG: hypothetical protein HYV04_05565 [Deltaproteobacteria bacterium]|nr:hypothetical protein [Deltaproteobacteria bacterium]